MKLGVFSPVLAGMSLEDSLKYLRSIGVDCLELGVGGFPGTAHADAKLLSKDKAAREALLELLKKYGITLSALSVHGNMVHPNPDIAKGFIEDFDAACVLAGQLGVERVVTFSGCPGDGKGDKPNWVTCPWPNDFSEILDYQWNEVLIPFWQKKCAFAREAGVKYIPLELHPGFAVYNPETLLRLHAVDGMLGANLDPSHLFWQGIDILSAIDAMKGAIYFFHAKDTEINERNVRVNGVLDTKSYADEANRSWIFRSVGYGHGALEWKRIASALRLAGYDHVMSIEHEDSLMTPKEGLEKAVALLQEVIIKERNDTEAWWI